MDKQALRAQIRAKKRALSMDEIERRSAILAEKLFETGAYRQARVLYAYLSFNQEVRTGPIIERARADGKRVAVPKVVCGEMHFIWLEPKTRLELSGYGVPEPAAEGPVAEDPGALILLPGLAFDRQGRRLGYGGGFYDRYLATHPGHPTVALCYDFQLHDCLEAEAHDIPAGLVITDA